MNNDRPEIWQTQLSRLPKRSDSRRELNHRSIFGTGEGVLQLELPTPMSSKLQIRAALANV